MLRSRLAGLWLVAALMTAVIGSGVPSVAASPPSGDWFHLSLRASEATVVSFTLKWTGTYGNGPAVAGNAYASTNRPLSVGASEVDQDGEVSASISVDGELQDLVIRPYPTEREFFLTSFGAIRAPKDETVHLVWFVTNTKMRLDQVDIKAESGLLTHEISSGAGSAAVELVAGSSEGTWIRGGPLAIAVTQWQLDMPAGVGAFLPCSYCEGTATMPDGTAFPSASIDGQTQGFQGFGGTAGRWTLEWSGVRANLNGRPSVAVHVPLRRWDELIRNGIASTDYAASQS